VTESMSRGVLDTPLEPVIGLAEGETRWRGTTTAGVTSLSPPSLRAKRSNPSFREGKNGLLRRGACHRARIRATRWLLAMTGLVIVTISMAYLDINDAMQPPPTFHGALAANGLKGAYLIQIVRVVGPAHPPAGSFDRLVRGVIRLSGADAPIKVLIS
jgi:hypothetical protein